MALSELVKAKSPVLLERQYLSSRIEAGALADTAIVAGLNENPGSILVVDIPVQVNSVVMPDNSILILAAQVTHRASASGHMLIPGSACTILGLGDAGGLNGNASNNPTQWRAVSCVNKSNVVLEDFFITNTKSAAAYFEGCTDTRTHKLRISNVVGTGEYAGGIYVTNCIRHKSSYNLIMDVNTNGIKFRADTLGLTYGCSSDHDSIYRAGFIGIANGKCQNHKVTNWYAVDCVDNGVDMNGCYDAVFDGGTSLRCQDGMYIGENNIDLCSVRNSTAIDCKRAGIGSMGSLTNCTMLDNFIDRCGSGIYASGYVGLSIRGNIIRNSSKKTYTDNETGQVKVSTGHGIGIQANLSAAHKTDIISNSFMSNAGYDVHWGVGTVADARMLDNDFVNTFGDGKVYLGSTFTNYQYKDNRGYRNEATIVLNLTGNGTTVRFPVNLPFTAANTNYTVESVVPDWTSTYRVLLVDQTTTGFSLEFGTAPPAGSTRRVVVRVTGLVQA